MISLVLGITACAQHEPQKQQSISVCDASGCADRPHDYASFDPERDTPDDDPGGKIASLETMAAQDPSAAYDLALRFFRGDGVRQDTYRSIKWMRDAGERGDLNAQKALGRLYLTGLGEMGADPGEAEKWLSITAGRGDEEANSLLQEATAARQSTQADYRWRKHWQPIFYNSWYSGYTYRWYWRTNRWNMYH
ncbi:MAG: sel1 repeat family protein [Methylococcales bacterium]|nr:sel1 repeat family protein [Methylococcales bacterium]